MELKVEIRTILGKKVKDLREKGFVPAELYGNDVKNLHLSVSEKEFKKIFKEAGESTVVNLTTEDKKSLPVMIHDVETDPISDRIRSIDFYQVKLTDKIRVSIPIEFIGEAPAVKTFGGILVKTLQKIELEALPNDLPHKIQVDLANLSEIGKGISIKDLKFSDKVKFFASPDTMIATVVEAKAEEVAPVAATETAGETPAAGAAAQPETPAASSSKETSKK